MKSPLSPRLHPWLVSLLWLLFIKSDLSVGFSSAFAPRASRSQSSLYSKNSFIMATEPNLAQHDVPKRMPTDLAHANEEKVSESKKEDKLKPEWVPHTRREAVRVFFFSKDGIGPLIVSITLINLLVWRLSSLGPLSGADLGAFVGTVVFWSFQEHVLHQRLLHSKLNWYGKQIHQGHHDKPYFHISIDPPHLMLGWMATVHVLFRYLLPLPIAISATLGYSLAGLFYEWAHYIVHTKVKPSSPFWKTVRDNHMRHHCVDDRFWYAFSLPYIDDLFGTNPPLAQVRALKRNEKLAAATAGAANQ